MGAQSISSFLNEKVGFINQYLPPKKHILTALKIIGFLASIYLIAGVGVPYILQGFKIMGSVPNPYLHGFISSQPLIAAQTETFMKGVGTYLGGCALAMIGVVGAGLTGYFLYSDLFSKQTSSYRWSR